MDIKFNPAQTFQSVKGFVKRTAGDVGQFATKTSADAGKFVTDTVEIVSKNKRGAIAVAGVALAAFAVAAAVEKAFRFTISKIANRGVSKAE